MENMCKSADSVVENIKKGDIFIKENEKLVKEQAVFQSENKNIQAEIKKLSAVIKANIKGANQVSNVTYSQAVKRSVPLFSNQKSSAPYHQTKSETIP